MKIGIVGCGTIGRFIALALDSGRIKARLGAIYDVDEARSRNLAKELKCKPPLASLQGVVDVADLIVEAATPAVMPKIVRLCLMAKKDVLTLSVGGLFGNEDLFDLAKERGCRIHIPSGAIGGIDLVRAAAMGTAGQVTLTTRKPPAHLLATPYLKDKGINLEKIRIVSLARPVITRPPLCPACTKRMTSDGKGKGYKCKKCDARADVPEVQDVARMLEPGWYEVPPTARRHLAKPLCRGVPEIVTMLA